MKKVLSMAIALCMMLTLTVAVFAEDTEVWSETTMFFSSGNWNTYTLDDGDGFLEALQTEGAVLVITRDAESGVTSGGGTSDTYENFAIVDSWYSADDYVWLGTAGHTAADEPSKAIIDCLSDDGLVCTYDAATVYARYIELGLDQGGTPTIISNTSAEGAYNITSVSVVVPEVTEEETVEEAETEDEAEDTTEAAEETTSSSSSSSSSSPDTGVALALIPMAIAGIAVVSSKKR
ncbi:MAG: hypothetical protein LUF29_07665 [Oscillospiraceae bacterium]|nr:hypothetical protein [Oscillospiraceae bacterium]